MGIQLPKANLSGAPQRRPQQFPLQEYLAVMGQNPYAQGLNQVGPALSQALQRRMQLKMNANAINQLASAAGEEPPSNTMGLDPNVYEKSLAMRSERKLQGEDKARRNIDTELHLLQLSQPSSTIDPLTQKLTTYPGLHGLSIQMDANGNPTLVKGDDFGVGQKPPRPMGAGSGSTVFKSEDSLRKEFMAESKGTQATFESADKALRLAQRQDAIGDTSLAFALTKGALGGSGRITQTEVNQYGPQLGGLPDRVQAAIRGLAFGQKFDPTIRKQVMDMVTQQATAEDAMQKDRENNYRTMATQYGLNPDRVVHDVRPPTLRPYLRPKLQPINPSGSETPEQRKARLLQELSGAQ